MSPLLEVCVDSVESAVAAYRGGAQRFELCANLVIGGTTPSVQLFKRVKELCPIPSRVLVRPRFGDFCYTDEEVAIMAEEIAMFRETGANGFVIGALTPDGRLAAGQIVRLFTASGKLPVALHRAFDMSVDPIECLKQAIDLGFSTILTSGQQPACIKGQELLARLHSIAVGHLEILAGGGIHASVIREIHANTGITSFHMSGKVMIDSPMIYRNTKVSMGLPGLSEYSLQRTDEEKVRAARSVLDSLE